MIYLLTVIAISLPVLGVLHYVYSYDMIKPEPIYSLFLTFLAGIAGGAISFLIGKGVGVSDIYVAHSTCLADYINQTLLDAIPDECLKLLALWLAIRPNKYFDEIVDGIVYAVCISLGFVFVENAIQLCCFTSHWYDTAVYRSFFILPGSLASGVCMGYFYSRIHFKPTSRPIHWLLVLGVPVACHALCNLIVLLYDQLNVESYLLNYLILFCLVGCTLAILKFAHGLIIKQIARDRKSSV